VPLTSLIAASLLIVACGVPVILWGNPYPEGKVGYWAWGSVVICLAAVLGWTDAGHAATRLIGGIRTVGAGISPAGFGFLVAVLATGLSALFANIVFRRAARQLGLALAPLVSQSPLVDRPTHTT
jgi:hypothetical protein